MLVLDKWHLTYCTNTHPGESWEEVFESLKTYTLAVKKNLVKKQAFGIGLRLSDLASKGLLEGSNLEDFKRWLIENNLYVFTLNGFPFGGFHRQRVKEDVHKPDWTTQERIDYTLRLAKILAELLPEDVEDGGISTSPISYRHWIKTEDEEQEVKRIATQHFALVIEKLHEIDLKYGRKIHIDIEPEPDGLIENSEEALLYYKNILLPEAGEILADKLNISSGAAEVLIKDHIRICYDICHSAVMYENPEEVLQNFKREGIKIGKVQISAAIKIALQEKSKRGKVRERLEPFIDPVYLHQVAGRRKNGSLERYRDLAPALETLEMSDAEEWRIHFHVPIFTEHYRGIHSTGEEIKKVFNHLKNNNFTNHLEIETYTWEVLPDEMKQELSDSIVREYEWVIENLE